MEKAPSKRTAAQNKAIHMGFELIANALNAAGKDMRMVLKPGVEIPWNKSSVKEYIFKPVMKVMTNKKSTSELNKIAEIDEVWEVVMRHLMQNGHIDEYIPFPSDLERHYQALAPLSYEENRI